MRTHPQSIEVVLRVLKKICEAADSTTAERFRACELILAAHGRLVLSPDKLSKHNGLRQIPKALAQSSTDKEIAGQVRAEQAEERKRQRQKRELTKLLAKYEGESQSGAKENKPDPRMEKRIEEESE
jgi:hypothetical protein